MFKDLDLSSIDSSSSSRESSRSRAWVQLSTQIDACSGIKQLMSLLTSPSASINLAGNTAKSSGGFKELRMTASVQGVATKQASRALISLFYPRMCVPAPLPQIVGERGLGNGKMMCFRLSNSSDRCNLNFSSPASISNCGEDSKSEVSPSKANINVTPAIAPLSPRNSLPSITPAPVAVNRNLLSTPSIGGLFISDDRPIPWQFTYFYKSGSLKDQFTAYMRFLPDGYCQGRGMDSIGPFLLRGKVDPDISGTTFSLCQTCHGYLTGRLRVRLVLP